MYNKLIGFLVDVYEIHFRPTHSNGIRYISECNDLVFHLPCVLIILRVVLVSTIKNLVTSLGDSIVQNNRREGKR
jgi:hypothetical protein